MARKINFKIISDMKGMNTKPDLSSLSSRTSLAGTGSSVYKMPEMVKSVKSEPESSSGSASSYLDHSGSKMPSPGCASTNNSHYPGHHPASFGIHSLPQLTPAPPGSTPTGPAAPTSLSGYFRDGYHYPGYSEHSISAKLNLTQT